MQRHHAATGHQWHADLLEHFGSASCFAIRFLPPSLAFVLAFNQPLSNPSLPCRPVSFRIRFPVYIIFASDGLYSLSNVIHYLRQDQV